MATRQHSLPAKRLPWTKSPPCLPCGDGCRLQLAGKRTGTAAVRSCCSLTSPLTQTSKSTSRCSKILLLLLSGSCSLAPLRTLVLVDLGVILLSATCVPMCVSNPCSSRATGSVHRVTSGCKWPPVSPVSCLARVDCSHEYAPWGAAAAGQGLEYTRQVRQQVACCASSRTEKGLSTAGSSFTKCGCISAPKQVGQDGGKPSSPTSLWEAEFADVAMMAKHLCDAPPFLLDGFVRVMSAINVQVLTHFEQCVHGAVKYWKRVRLISASVARVHDCSLAQCSVG